MTKEEIIKMAKQAGMIYREFSDEFANGNTDGVDLETMENFAELVAQAERKEWETEFAGMGEWACVYLLQERNK